MNRDFAEMLAALSEAGADFIIVGAHALAVHGRPRATGDLDIWVRPSPENADRVWRALMAFGAPLADLTVADLATPGIVFQIGLPPCRIDILTEISGVGFAQGWEHKLVAEVAGQRLPFLGRAELLQNKRAAARPKDLADVDALESGDESGNKPK